MKHAKIIKGHKPSANDDVPEDEITLAELIQNAAARGLTSVRGTLFAKKLSNKELTLMEKGKYCIDTLSDDDIIIVVSHEYSEEMSVSPTTKRLRNPPKGTTCACALGAQALTPRVTRPLLVVDSVLKGNDKKDDEIIESYGDQRSADIGAAYEQALRPE